MSFLFLFVCSSWNIRQHIINPYIHNFSKELNNLFSYLQKIIIIHYITGQSHFVWLDFIWLNLILTQVKKAAVLEVCLAHTETKSWMQTLTCFWGHFTSEGLRSFTKTVWSLSGRREMSDDEPGPDRDISQQTHEWSSARSCRKQEIKLNLKNKELRTFYNNITIRI